MSLVGSLSCQRVRLNLRAMLFICIHVSSSILFSFHPIIISIRKIVALQRGVVVAVLVVVVGCLEK